MTVDFNILEALTLVNIAGGKGADTMRFTTDTGRVFEQSHSQDCCESVAVDEIIGDLNDLLNTPILEASERTSRVLDLVDQVKVRIGIMEDQRSGESETWTFYSLRTIKGSVTIRWYGTSNGYYSESVDFYEVGTNG